MSPMMDEEMALMGYVVVMNDVSYIKRRELELEEYNLKTELVNRICNIILWEYDLDRRVLNVYSGDSIIPYADISQETYLRYVHPEDRQKVKDVFVKADNLELDIIHLAIRFQSPDMEGVKQIVLDGVAVKDEKGRIIKYTGIRRILVSGRS